MLQALEVYNILDNIIIASESDDEHEKHGRHCLQRMLEKGLSEQENTHFFSSHLWSCSATFSVERELHHI